MANTFTSSKTGHTFKPDTQVTCFDYLYFVSTSHIFEWEQQYSSAWNIVGKYARWSDKIRGLARESIALTLGMNKRDVMRPGHGDRDWRDDRDGRKYHEHDLKALDERDKIRVPYISIHARHGDFLENCTNRPGKPCYPPLSSFALYVEEIEEELRDKGIIERGRPRLPVIITSDEKDPKWWEEVAQHGWKRVVFPSSLSIPEGLHGMEKHLDAETYERFWSRMLVEVAVQGYGTGFIGTQESTMSLLARRRVEHWQKGVTRTVAYVTFPPFWLSPFFILVGFFWISNRRSATGDREGHHNILMGYVRCQTSGLGVGSLGVYTSRRIAFSCIHLAALF